MSTSVFDHPWLAGLFGDADMAGILSAERQMAHMLAFEAAWSRACGRAGLFNAELADQAATVIEAAQIDLTDIAAGMGQDGVPIPRLVAQLKAIAPAEAVHKGATSQDVIDTAMVLALREASELMDQRLNTLEQGLSTLEDQFGDAPLMGRTRMQAATPITVRDRVQTWRLPLTQHRARLQDLRPRVERVQIGGASGDRRALGDQAQKVVADVADALGLAPTNKAWHAMRDGVADYASVLSLITGTLGKMGQDLALMAQQGIEDVALSGGGGSSAMPHKQNPIAAELLVTLARFNATQLAGMHQALVHEQERSGTAWTLEWMILPQMLMATGRALVVGNTLCQSITRLGAAAPE